MDQAIFFTLLGRSWSTLAGLITLWFIAGHLSHAEQGFYYTFSSILALQIVFELGMSYVVMQFASHEMANLAWTTTGTIQGNEVAKSRLRSLVILTLRWYGVIAILIVLVILPAGWVFFTINQNSADVTWHLAWAWLIFTAALSIFSTPIFAMLEGCGRVTDVARMRLIQGVVGSFSGWLVLSAGGGLLAMPVFNTGALIVAVLWLWFSKREFFHDLLATKSQHGRISWRKEIWPFQWKIALSWLSGYFIFNLFTPVLFAYRGPVEAGQMGMSLTIANAIMAIPIAWMNTKAPFFGALIAKGDFQELDRLFFSTLSKSLGIMVFLAILISVVVFCLHFYGAKIASRVLEPHTFAILMLTTTIVYIGYAQATYLRAHKEEPFLGISVLSGLLVGVFSIPLAKSFGSLGLMMGYLGMTMVIGLVWGPWIFYSKRRAWYGASLKWKG